MSEERGPYMNEEKNVRMEDSREEPRRDFVEDGEDKSKICALLWDVYTRYKYGLINREF